MSIKDTLANLCKTQPEVAADMLHDLKVLCDRILLTRCESLVVHAEKLKKKFQNFDLPTPEIGDVIWARWRNKCCAGVVTQKAHPGASLYPEYSPAYPVTSNISKYRIVLMPNKFGTEEIILAITPELTWGYLK